MTAGIEGSTGGKRRHLPYFGLLLRTFCNKNPTAAVSNPRVMKSVKILNTNHEEKDKRQDDW